MLNSLINRVGNNNKPEYSENTLGVQIIAMPEAERNICNVKNMIYYSILYESLGCRFNRLIDFGK